MAGTLVHTQDGPVQGIQEGTVATWKGIPYAQPPQGELRFRPPRRPDAWSAVLPAMDFGPVAMQPPTIEALAGRRLPMSEDCLTLNIWSPGADGQRRPVLVWIHGGGFLIGSGCLQDGTALASRGDVVVVTLNYRLGPLGFLHLGDLGGAPYAASGNCGLLDQVAALRWVHDNIAAFGGDPQRVTVFGESAGAMSIGTLLALPAAQLLFQRAILHSGAVAPVRSSAEATATAGTVLEILGVSRTNLSHINEIPADRLVEAATALPDWHGTRGAGDTIHFAPVIDGVMLPQPPLPTIAQGVAKDIPLIIGTTKDECLLYPFADPTWRQAADETLLQRCQHLVGARWPAVAPLYLHDHRAGEPLLPRVLALLTFDQFTFPAIQLAEAQACLGAPVWVYRFDWPSPVFGGAAHSLDRLFVWNDLEAPGARRMTGEAPERLHLAHQMQDAWLAFARHGDPATPDLPPWPRYDLDHRATLLFDRESTIHNDPQAEARRVWATATPPL